MKKSLKKAAKNFVQPSSPLTPLLVSHFLKSALREMRVWPLQFLNKKGRVDYMADESVNLPNALYALRIKKQQLPPAALRQARKKICPITGRAKSVGGRFGLSRITVRSHIKGTFLSGYKKASW